MTRDGSRAIPLGHSRGFSVPSSQVEDRFVRDPPDPGRDTRSENVETKRLGVDVVDSSLSEDQYSYAL